MTNIMQKRQQLKSWNSKQNCSDDGSDRFVKKKHWGVAVRQEGEGAAGTTCNTNTGVRIDPQELKSTETRGVKKIIGRVEPPPGKSDPGWRIYQSHRSLASVFFNVDNPNVPLLWVWSFVAVMISNSSPGMAIPTGMRSAFIAIVADVSNVTSPFLHCTAMGLCEPWVHKETLCSESCPTSSWTRSQRSSCDKLFHLLMTRTEKKKRLATMKLNQFPRLTTSRHMLSSQCE